MSEVVCLHNLGVVEYASGNIDRAIEVARIALDRVKSQLGHAYLSRTLTNLGAFLIAKGECAEARSHLEEAFSVIIGRGETPPEASLRVWAVLAGLEGRLKEAAQLIGFADADRSRQGQSVQPAERILHTRLMTILQAGLPPADLEILKSGGATWNEAKATDFVATHLLQADEIVRPAA